MAVKTTSFIALFLLYITHKFRFLHDLDLINLSVMFLNKNDLFMSWAVSPTWWSLSDYIIPSYTPGVSYSLGDELMVHKLNEIGWIEFA